MDLLATIGLSLLMVLLVTFTSGVVRIALGLAFVLFLPGYALLAALFPNKADLEGMERLALSFGLSLALVPLIGLGLNYTPWGISLYPISLSLASFILAMVAVAFYQRRKLPAEERFTLELSFQFARGALRWGSQSRWDRLLTMVLFLAILTAIGTLGYVFATPKVGERFTEFYALDSGGNAEGYPKKIALNEEARVRLGVVNNEQELVVYHIAITIDGEKVKEIGPVSLEPEQRWEEEVAFRPEREGLQQKVEFLLYKGEASELYRSLFLWVDVK